MSRSSKPPALHIGPSIISADFLRLGDQLAEINAGQADYVHVDVMDGLFVPNISIGIPILQAVRRGASLPVDVHLMITHPDDWVTEFCRAGADSVTFHVEATPHAHRVVQAIVAEEKVAGVALNPATPVAQVEELVPHVGQVLVMTVNPGFGGQSFIKSCVDKVRRVRELIDRHNPECRLQVDGGINAATVRAVVEAGADTIVAGTATFTGGRTIAENIADLRRHAG